ncbi:STAS/SEC14 domain-containing protein [candidate division WOR-3 bacterium]|nr:STAS/SEC14 domain-containing protein [candidate division WOR-3 bacterium]
MWKVDKKRNEATLDEHKLIYDPQEKIMTVKMVSSMSLEELLDGWKFIDEMTKDLDKYCFLVDLTETKPVFDKDFRDYLQGKNSDERILKMAVVFSNPVVRMFARVMASKRKKTPTGYFKTRDEALAWLKER